jgi:hypothetical protein
MPLRYLCLIPSLFFCILRAGTPISFQDDEVQLFLNRSELLRSQEASISSMAAELRSLKAREAFLSRIKIRRSCDEFVDLSDVPPGLGLSQSLAEIESLNRLGEMSIPEAETHIERIERDLDTSIRCLTGNLTESSDACTEEAAVLAVKGMELWDALSSSLCSLRRRLEVFQYELRNRQQQLDILNDRRNDIHAWLGSDGFISHGLSTEQIFNIAESYMDGDISALWQVADGVAEVDVQPFFARVDEVCEDKIMMATRDLEEIQMEVIILEDEILDVESKVDKVAAWFL